MSDWYFEKNGERGGPISADELKEMVASGSINLANLVWTAAFGSEWKRLGETELAPPQPAMPPPLPSKEPPVLPPKSEKPASEPSDFLDSELTKTLIGKKQDHYLAKWRTILAKAGGNPTKIATISSWTWPALFLPYCWLLYRKMYVLGGFVFAFQLVYVLLPESVPTLPARLMLLGTFALGIVFALYGNAWYLDIVRKRWEVLRTEPDQPAALATAKREGGVDLIAPIVAFALVIAAVVGPHLITSNSPVALVRDGHMSAYPGTTVGKAFDGNFDGGTWRSFTTAKGQQVVEFSGKINAVLHANAVQRLWQAGEELQKGASSKTHGDQLEFNYRLNVFQVAYRYLDGKPELQRLLQKWECGKVEQVNLAGPWVGMLPTCNEHLYSFLGDVIDAWASKAHWPLGAPVTVQWTIRVDGEGFDLTQLSSKAWEGREQDHILDTLFQ